MGVELNHAKYDRMKKVWKKVRDCIEGEEAIKAAGDLYLPRLSSHGPTIDGEQRYEAYKQRAMFYNAAQRTAAGLTGAATRKAPDVSFPENKKSLIMNPLDTGGALTSLAMTTIEELVGVGRIILLVDAQDDGDPFIVTYFAEDLTNWRIGYVEGNEVLELAVLREIITVPDDKDEFAHKEVERRRVLRLVDGVYTQQLWEKSNDQAVIATSAGGSGWVIVEEEHAMRKRGGATWDHIPIVVSNATRASVNPENPPMLDMINVNLSHYRNSADLEHGIHWTALPTAWASGFPLMDRHGKDVEMAIGSEAAWMTEQTGAEAGYLEFSGAGLGSIREAMKEKQGLMAVLGARLLEEPKSAVEAAETFKVRQQGELSVLARIAQNAGDALTRTLRNLLEWDNPTANLEEVSVSFATDFVDASLTPSQLSALTAALQSGGISWQTYFWNLKRGEVVPDSRTEEEETTFIEAGAPTGPAPLPTPGGGFPFG